MTLLFNYQCQVAQSLLQRGATLTVFENTLTIRELTRAGEATKKSSWKWQSNDGSWHPMNPQLSNALEALSLQTVVSVPPFFSCAPSSLCELRKKT